MSTQISLSRPIKLEVNVTPITGGSAGQILFQTTGNTVGESANLFWDNTNSILQITKALGATMRLNCTSSNPSKFQFTQELSVGVPTEIGFISNEFGTGMILQSFNSLYFNANNAEKMRIVSGTGNVLINTTTDAGSKLQVKSSITNGTGTEAIRAYGTSNYIGMHYDEGRGPVFITNYVGVGGNSPGSFNFYTSAGSVLASIGSGGVYSHNINGKVSSGTNNGFINLWNGASGDMELVLTTNHNITFSTNNTERLRITNAGNVGIGTSSPAQKLDVNGNTQITGNLIFPAGERLIQYGASSFFAGRDGAAVYLAYGFGAQQTHIGSASTGNILLRTSGNVCLDNATSKLLIGTITDAGYKLDVNGTARVSSRFTIGSDIIPSAAGSSVALAAHVAAGSILDLSYYTGSQNALSTTKSVIFHGITFSPSSGTAIFNQLNIAPILNQTGTANGAVRGFYYNPTVTSVLGSHWAIHTTAGRVRFEGLPTSPAGLNAGDLYNNLGVLMIV